MKYSHLEHLLLGAFIALIISCNPTQEAHTPLSSSPSPPAKPIPSHLSDFSNWENFDTGGNVKTLALDNDQLWMGMPTGVIRYDTRTLDDHEIYTSSSTDGGLMSRGIYVIKVGPKGGKWIGTYGGGLTRYDGKTWKTYTIEDGLGDQWVYDVVWDQNGKMWVATWKGVSVFDGEKFKTYREKDGLADKWVYAIALDHDNIFWFGTEKGISRFDPKQSGRAAWTTYTYQEGVEAGFRLSETKVTDPSDSFPSPASDDEDSSEYESAGNRHHMDPTKDNVGPNPNFILAAEVDRDNRKWFGTWGAGLSSFDGKVWTAYTDADGLGGNFIHALKMDPEGILWAGTNGGASWFDGNRWHNLSEKEGLINNNVFSVAFDPKGRRWFGTWEGLSMYRGKIPPTS